MWNTIFKTIQEKNYEILMVAIGSSMARYEEINDNNNQQYPGFLRPYDHSRKLIILVDPELEYPIKLANYQSLTIIPNSELFNKKCTFYQGTLNDILAVNTGFDYDTSPIHDLVLYCMEVDIKLIWQDYTGRITTEIFINLFNIIGPEILKYILFDASEKDDGCFINFSKIVLKIDHRKFFIQPRYLRLSQIINVSGFNKYFKDRISLLRFPLLWKYKNSEKMAFGVNDDIGIKILFIIYGECPLHDLVEIIMKDICEVLKIEYHSSIYSHYFHNMKNDPLLYNECSQNLRTLSDSLI